MNNEQKALMQAFETFLDEEVQKINYNVIGIGSKPSELRGVGTEYLVVEGQVIAKFYNGNIVRNVPVVEFEEATLR